jgi:hypothetical protein
MSALTLMAAALQSELARRNISALDLTPVGAEECADILRTVIDRTAAVGQSYETSHPGRPMPPSIGRVTDGGCITPSDASAVDFVGPEGGRER